MTEDKTRRRIAIPDEALAAFCRRWKISDLAFFQIRWGLPCVTGENGHRDKPIHEQRDVR